MITSAVWTDFDNDKQTDLDHSRRMDAGKVF